MDNISHILLKIAELKDDEAEIIEKYAASDDFSTAYFLNKMKAHKSKKKYYEEILKTLIIARETLKSLKGKDKKEIKALKNISNYSKWEVFKNNLKDNEWMPFEEEICDTCGRTHSSTTSIAVAILPNGNLDIICNRCFKKFIKDYNKKKSNNIIDNKENNN